MTPLRLAVSIHDVSPATWPLCRRLLAVVERSGCAPCTLLVVPDHHRSGRCDLDRDFVRAIGLRLARGDEVALHGYFHLDDAPLPVSVRAWVRRRLLTAGEGEFAGLAPEEAAARLARGRRLFARLGWPTRGFVPPAWLFGPGQVELLGCAGFAWTSTRDALWDLRAGVTRAAPSLTCSVRSPWRRLASRSWLAIGERLYAGQGLLRVALHPADARHPGVLESWARLLVRLRRAREPLLEGDWTLTSAVSRESARGGSRTGGSPPPS